MRLRPRFRVIMPVSVPSRVVVLLDSHLRQGGDDTPHNCAICLVALKYNLSSTVPAWAQCCNCADVVHRSCLDKWVESSTHLTQFTCPACRCVFECDVYEDDPDAWNADRIVDSLQQEDDSSYEVSECEEGDSDRTESEGSESEAQDDDDASDVSAHTNGSREHDAPPAKRTRSGTN